MSNAGITSSCVVIDSFVVSRINVFVSSSSKSSQRQISSIFCLSALRRVSFGLTPRKNPMLASFWELNFSIFRNDKFARSVSMIPSDEEYLDPYFICDRVNSDSSVKDIYTRLVILQILWFGKVMMCSLSDGKVLLLVILLFSRVMIATDSSIFLIASKFFLWILDEFMIEFGFSGRMSRVHFVVNLLLMTVAVVACAIRRL